MDEISYHLTVIHSIKKKKTILHFCNMALRVEASTRFSIFRESGTYSLINLA